MAKKNGVNAAEALAKLKRDISENNIGKLYLFCGEEAYLKEYYLNEIKKRIVLSDESNLYTLSGRAFTPQEFYDAVTSFSLTAERKLVIVRDYDILCPDAKMLPVAEALLPAIPDSCCLIFVYDDTMPGEGRVNKKMEDAVGKYAQKVEFVRPGEAEYLRWIIRRFAALGKTCGQREAKRLSEYCGGLMYAALPEIEKIAAYAEGGAITEKDIEEIAYPLTETIIYKMTNAISAGNSGEAVALLDRLMEQGTDGKSAVMEIGRAIRRLYAAKLSAESGLGTADYMAAAKIRSAYAADIDMRQARRFRLSDLRRNVILCNEAEQRMLRGRVNEKIVLETLIYELGPERNG